MIRPMNALKAAITLAFRPSSNRSSPFNKPIAAVFSFPLSADVITKLKKLTLEIVEVCMRIKSLVLKASASSPPIESLELFHR